MKKIAILALGIILIMGVDLASAVVIQSVLTEEIVPGESGLVRLDIENILQDDVEDISIRLDFTDLPFTPVGSSEEGIDELNSGDDEEVSIRIKASNDIVPGDYKIPYTLTYYVDGERKERTGSIGIRVKGESEISFSVSAETPVIGEEGVLNLKIVNRGFSDARFVLVKVFPEGYTLLSEDEVYVGNVDSDDFETASFDVIFRNNQANLVAIVEYRNFDNEVIKENINLPVTIYSRNQAVELGIIQKNNTLLYIGLVVVLIVLWIIWRAVRKRRRIKQSRGG